MKQALEEKLWLRQATLLENSVLSQAAEPAAAPCRPGHALLPDDCSQIAARQPPA